LQKRQAGTRGSMVLLMKMTWAFKKRGIALGLLEFVLDFSPL